jgi:methylmalonyl-CoA/ethylmalonyl-CoA epimerase
MPDVSVRVRSSNGNDHDVAVWPAVISESRLSNSFLGNLIEVCIVSRDHRRMMEGMVRLGIGPWRVHTFDSSTVTEQTYGGEPAEYVLKVCFAQADNVVWEIIQPIDGPTILHEFLDEHGEGIHHVAFDCAGAPWEARLAGFVSRGFQLTQSGRFAGENVFAFFGTEGATGATFETYLIPEGFVWPEPEEWFPGAPPRATNDPDTPSSGSAPRTTPIRVARPNAGSERPPFK